MSLEVTDSQGRGHERSELTVELSIRSQLFSRYSDVRQGLGREPAETDLKDGFKDDYENLMDRIRRKNCRNFAKSCCKTLTLTLI